MGKISINTETIASIGNPEVAKPKDNTDGTICTSPGDNCCDDTAGNETCQNTCWNTCLETCENTCPDTCENTCPNTCPDTCGDTGGPPATCAVIETNTVACDCDYTCICLKK